MGKRAPAANGGREGASRESQGGVLREIALALAEELRDREERAARQAELERERKRQASERALRRKERSGLDDRRAQDALMKALQRLDEKGLKAALAQPGFSPTFVSDGVGARETPLGMAARIGWGRGVALLLEAGAADPDGLRSASGAEAMGRALDIAAEERDGEMFRALLRAEADPERRAAGAAKAFRSSHAALLAALEEMGARAVPEGEDPFGEDLDHMDLEGWGREDLREIGRCQRKLAELFPERAREGESAIRLWETAIACDDPELAGFLAGMGAIPAARGEPWMLPSKRGDLERHFSAWRMTEECFPHEAREERERRMRREPEGDSERSRASALALAAWGRATDLAGMLARVATLRQRALSDPASVDLLSACAHRETLERLRDCGIEMEGLRDGGNGMNPLHRIFLLDPNLLRLGKSGAREALRICPEWAGQRDSQGRSPLDLLADPKMKADLERSELRAGIGRSAKARGKAKRQRGI